MTAAEKEVVGCSIVPFSVDPEYNSIYFLLGKERPGQWRGSNTWSDFGGKKQCDETSEACAAREFHEETMGIVKLYDNERVPRDSEEILTDMLADERYCMRLEYKSDRNVYHTFVKQIPWQPECSLTFTQTKTALLTVRQTPDVAPMTAFLHPATYNITEDRRTARVNDAYLEKRTLRYFSIPELMGALAHPKRYLCGREVVRDSFVHRLSMVLRQFRHECVDCRMLPIVREVQAPAVKPPAENSWWTVKHRGKQYHHDPDPELRHGTAPKTYRRGHPPSPPCPAPVGGPGAGSPRRAAVQNAQRTGRVSAPRVLPQHRQSDEAL